MQNWIVQELDTVDLGDERLDRRFHLVLDALAGKPSLKFNAACRGHAEVVAAYRFVNHPRIDPSKILAPHFDASLLRIAEHPVVLLVQDTSELDLSRPNEVMSGSGPLNDSARRGFFLHPLLAFTPDALPLGLVHVDLFARDDLAFARPAAEKAAQRRRDSIQDKESMRWLDGYRQGSVLATSCPQTQFICISDSESDIFECFLDAVPVEGQRKADWIVRACQDRALVASEHASEQPCEENKLGRLFSEVAKAEVLTTLTLEIRERPAKSGDDRKRKQARSARTATVTVQAMRLTLRGPSRTGQGKLPDVTVNGVLLREENPPEGEEAIEWLLLSSLAIDTKEQVLAIVAAYCVRWQIEIYFKVVKSGCKVEESQLETAEAFLPYVAMCLIVAWRVMYTMMLGRECPEMNCESVLERDEWQAVYSVVKKTEPPEETPTLGEMVEMIGKLGGWLGRKGDGPPGPKAMWIGMQRMADLTLGWRARVALPSTPKPTASTPKPSRAASAQPRPAPDAVPRPPSAPPTVQSSV